MRCFIGFLIPSDLRKDIVSLQEKIKNLPIKAKFVEPENLHVCLSFLGEKSEKEIDEISRKLDKISINFKSFEVRIKGIKLIPNERYVRVIALDVFDENRILEGLRLEVKRIIGGDSKPSHVTLCRVKNIFEKGKFLEGIKEFKEISIGKFKLSALQLIKSELRKTGPIYTVLHESKLS